MMTIAEQTSPRDLASPDAGRVALKGFFRIADAWGLTQDEQRRLLGDIPRSTLYNYRQLPRTSLRRDLLERISYILGIYKALRILFSREDLANAWVRRPNHAAPFNGQSALERMLAGNVNDLAIVRQYLDAQRGW